MKPTFFFQGGLYFFLLCVTAMIGTVAAFQAGDRAWLLGLVIAVFSGVMAYRRINANDL